MNRGPSAGLVLGLCLLFALLGAASADRTPTPRGAEAPASAFSAERAMDDVRLIARRPRPVGSLAAAAAREALMARLKAMGLDVVRQRAASAVEAGGPGEAGVVAGEVENIIGVLKGADAASPAVYLTAHTDTAPASPGAADDAAGVAAALETARALSLEPHRRRSLVLLFTDGAKASHLGARAFFRAPPPGLPPAGVVLNLEARGGGGRVVMLQASRRSGGLIRVFRRAVSDTDASSALWALNPRASADTDLTPALEAGVQGLDFAFLGAAFDDQASTSTPETLDEGALQHLGDQALKTAHALLVAPALPARSPDLVYGDLFGRALVVYPAAAGGALLTVAIGVLLIGLRLEQLSGAKLASAVSLGRRLLLTFAPAASGLLFLRAAAALIDGDVVRQRLLLAEPLLVDLGLMAFGLGGFLLGWRRLAAGPGSRAATPVLYALALIIVVFKGPDVAALAVILAALGLHHLSDLFPDAEPPGWASVLTSGVIVTAALQIASPTTAVLTLWPLLLGALAYGLTQILAYRDGLRDLGRSVVVVLAVVTCAWLGRWGALVFELLGPTAPDRLAAPLYLASFALYPFLPGDLFKSNRADPGMLLTAAGALILALVLARDPFSDRRPRPSEVFFIQKEGARSGALATTLPLDPWSRSALKEGAGLRSRTLAPFFDALTSVAAPAVDLRGPDVVASRAEARSGSVITAVLSGGTPARSLQVVLAPDAALQDFRVAGVAVKTVPRPGAPVRIEWVTAERPLTLSFRGPAKGRVRVDYETLADRLPAGVDLPPRPAGSEPTPMSDTTVLIGSGTLRWEAEPASAVRP